MNKRFVVFRPEYNEVIAIPAEYAHILAECKFLKQSFEGHLPVYTENDESMRDFRLIEVASVRPVGPLPQGAGVSDESTRAIQDPHAHGDHA